jgi:uncharacterized tellurite resistance protein B-like protein
MLRSLRALFEQQIAKFADEPEAAHSLELAGAALLMEISRADDNVSGRERAAIMSALTRVFHLADDELEDLVAAATEAVDSAVSLFDFTVIINQRFGREQKLKLLEMLWSVAYADDKLDRYEEYYVRKIADLLYISHSDYIKAKLSVMPASAHDRE